MKPGMQRDIVVAYWLLFDEFELGEDDPAAPDADARPAPAPVGAATSSRTAAGGGSKRS